MCIPDYGNITETQKNFNLNNFENYEIVFVLLIVTEDKILALQNLNTNGNETDKEQRVVEISQMFIITCENSIVLCRTISIYFLCSFRC